jgi:hypothetical protein
MCYCASGRMSKWHYLVSLAPFFSFA